MRASGEAFCGRMKGLGGLLSLGGSRWGFGFGVVSSCLAFEDAAVFLERAVLMTDMHMPYQECGNPRGDVGSGDADGNVNWGDAFPAKAARAFRVERACHIELTPTSLSHPRRCHTGRAPLLTAHETRHLYAPIALLTTATQPVACAMVVVRASPRAKVSPDKNSAAWPPKSPFQALLSSPGGRKKWQDRKASVQDRSPSPSPLRRPLSSSKKLQAMSRSEHDEDEDEEDIELRLEEIRLRQKQKKLGKQRRQQQQQEARSSSRPDSRATSPRKTVRPPTAEPRVRAADVEVPLSPTRERMIIPREQLSPARKRLGLETATRASDVSLKRARDGTRKRPNSVRSGVNVEPPKLSFNQRLQASKQTADDREAKFDRIERSRSNGFGKDATTVGTSRRAVDGGGTALKRSDSLKRPSSAREAQPASRLSKEALTPRSASERVSHSTQQRPTAKGIFRNPQSGPTANQADSDSELEITPDASEDTPSSSYDPFSEIHLSKRNIPHSVVAREMEGKEIYTLPRLLKEVKSPDYDPPDCEEDFVVFAVLASKSSPYDTKASHRTSDMNKPQEDARAPRNKFLVLKLTDLKWELDLFLFGTGFDQFWKLTPGTLLAILNPAILPPKTNQHNGRFGLKLSSCEDKVMEIGIARDLGYCSSIKRDGQQCGEWVDKRSTDICEFHLNLFIEKQRKGRMEVNTMWRGSATGNSDFRAKSHSREAGGFDRQMKQKKGVTSHREYGTLYSVPSSLTGMSATKILDAEDTDRLNGYTEGEKSRARIAAAQKERELERSLKRMGNGVGKEYLQASSKKATTTTTTATVSSSRSSQNITTTSAVPAEKAIFDKPSIASLGLLNNKASETHLSPAKDRKPHFGLGAVSSTGREPMGWGGARKAGLLQPKESKLGSPEKGQTTLDSAVAGSKPMEKLSSLRPPAVRARSREGSLSPSKKARFMLEGKGIREPGRESGGRELFRGLGDGGGRKTNDNNDDEDDDDLDIV
jgi:minichromosome maintenance protein 10